MHGIKTWSVPHDMCILREVDGAISRDGRVTTKTMTVTLPHVGIGRDDTLRHNWAFLAYVSADTLRGPRLKF